MSVLTTRGVGYAAAAPTEIQLALVPKRYTRDGTVPGIVWCHASISAPYDAALIDNTQPNMRALHASIAAKYPVLAPDLGGDNWANDTGIARVGSAIAYLQGTLGAKAGKVALIGYSMGGALALAYARANPTLVSCVVLILPVSNLTAMHTGNRPAGATAAINAAYGGAYSEATYGATHNPETFKASLAGLKAQIWYSTADATVLPAEVVSVATAIGASADVHSMTGVHGNDSTLAGVDVTAVLSFLAANA